MTPPASVRLLAILAAATLPPACEPRSGPPVHGEGETEPGTVISSSVVRDHRCTFVDVTAAAGIDFEHATGATGEKLLPETLGAGAAFLDHDGDGRLDIFFVNSGHWPTAEAGAPNRGSPGDASPPICRLYRGRGDGTFEDVTAETGCGIAVYGMGCAVADYDGDGDDDIYVTAVGDNVLLRNDGGVFRDVARLAGVAGGRWHDRDGTAHPEWSTAAAWLDVDVDGRLDLFVSNYVEWSPEHEIFTTLDGVHKAFTTPDRYNGLPPRLFLNRGDGAFADVSRESGVAADAGKSLGVALWDFDRNGLLDIAVANDTRPNFLFFNEGETRFTERGSLVGIAYDENGRARAGMGIDVADHANDGVPAIAIGNFSAEPISLYRWSPEKTFLPAAARAGIAEPTFAPLTFGLLFADVDLDGSQDLVVVNGHIEPEIRRTQPHQSHAQRAQLFLGREGGTFEDASEDAGPDFTRPRVARGLAAGDIDGDGDLDLLVTTNGGQPALLRNDLAPGPHWLRVRLRGETTNTRAIGATVRLTAGGATQTRLCRTGSSYLSQSETTLTFGLGAAEHVERLEVRWPDGTASEHAVREVDVTVEVSE